MLDGDGHINIPLAKYTGFVTSGLHLKSKLTLF